MTGSLTYLYFYYCHTNHYYYAPGMRLRVLQRHHLLERYGAERYGTVWNDTVRNGVDFCNAKRMAKLKACQLNWLTMFATQSALSNRKLVGRNLLSMFATQCAWQNRKLVGRN